MHLKGPAQQMLAALPPSDTIEYVTLINCLQQRFGQRHLAIVNRRELKNRIQKSGEGLQDYEVDMRHLAQKVHPSMDPQFVESAAVDRFVDGIRDWEV